MRFHHLLTVPNLISLFRLLIVPVLLLFAARHQTTLFLTGLALAFFTDVLDGFLARVLNQITPLGSRLDSWGDFFIYSTMAIGAWLQWPDTVRQYWLESTLIVTSFVLPTIVAALKFKSIVSYHTWSVKVAVGMTMLGYFTLFAASLGWPFQIAAALCCFAAAEEIAITTVLKRHHSDIRSLRQAITLKQ